jgi:hypothetical protein
MFIYAICVMIYELQWFGDWGGGGLLSDLAYQDRAKITLFTPGAHIEQSRLVWRSQRLCIFQELAEKIARTRPADRVLDPLPFLHEFALGRTQCLTKPKAD